MIILNEKSFAEQCLKNGMPDDVKPYRVLLILAKYYSYTMGYKKKRIVKGLTQYIARNYPHYHFEEQKWNEAIEDMASNVKKYKYYEIDGVWVSKVEIDAISTIGNKVIEKLAFTLLCIAKLNHIKNPNCNFWVYNDYKELFKLARVSCAAGDRCKLIRQLYLGGYIELAKRVDDLSLRVTFASDKEMYDKHRGDIFIDDFRELGYEYLYRVKGEDFIRCGECGILVRSNKKHSRKYCSKCVAYSPMRIKTIKCVDCGKEFSIMPFSRVVRCDECRLEHRRNTVKENVKRFRMENM